MNDTFTNKLVSADEQTSLQKSAAISKQQYINFGKVLEVIT